MNADKTLIVDALVDTALALSTELRLGKGIDELLQLELLATIEQFRIAYSKSESIPKRAAAVLIDLYPAIDGCSGLYSLQIAEQIRNLALELWEAAGNAIAVDEPDN